MIGVQQFFAMATHSLTNIWRFGVCMHILLYMNNIYDVVVYVCTFNYIWTTYMTFWCMYAHSTIYEQHIWRFGVCMHIQLYMNNIYDVLVYVCTFNYIWTTYMTFWCMYAHSTIATSIGDREGDMLWRRIILKACYQCKWFNDQFFWNIGNSGYVRTFCISLYFMSLTVVICVSMFIFFIVDHNFFVISTAVQVIFDI